MAGSPLGSGVHFLSVLLVLENDSDVVGQLQEVWVSELEDTSGLGSEDNSSHLDPFCFAWMGSFCVFASAHGEEKCS